MDVEIWTQDADGTWTEWSQAIAALEAVVSGAGCLVVIQREITEEKAIAATLRLARRFANGPVRLVAGNEHPTASWCQAARSAGADMLLLVSEDGRRERPPPLNDDCVEIGCHICPSLAARQSQGVTLSLCGRCRLSVVLPRRHLLQWCLPAKEHCPHEQGTLRG
jgi:hypothetical protein